MCVEENDVGGLRFVLLLVFEFVLWHAVARAVLRVFGRCRRRRGARREAYNEITQEEIGWMVEKKW